MGKPSAASECFRLGLPTHNAVAFARYGVFIQATIEKLPLVNEWAASVLT